MSLNDFEKLTLIGTGSYSSVYKVQRIADGKEYALKKVKMSGLSETLLHIKKHLLIILALHCGKRYNVNIS